MNLQAKWGSTVLCLFSGQGLHSCQRSSKRYHVCWASGEHFEIWICNEGKLLMCFVCRVLERPPRALSSPITIRRRDGKRPLFAQILSGHLKSVLKFLENAILGLAHTTNWSKMQPKQPFLWVLHRGVYWSLKQMMRISIRFCHQAHRHQTRNRSICVWMGHNLRHRASSTLKFQLIGRIQKQRRSNILETMVYQINF